MNRLGLKKELQYISFLLDQTCVLFRIKQMDGSTK